MITQQDSLQLQRDFKKVFPTREEINARFKKIDDRLREMKKDDDEQTLALGQTFNDIFQQLRELREGQAKIMKILAKMDERLTRMEKRQDRMETRQARMEAKQDNFEEFMKVMSIKLLNHDGRIVTLESKILLS